LKTEDTAVYYC
nr:immunoglobulin heavy chain junction region [Homo sapiens]